MVNVYVAFACSLASDANQWDSVAHECVYAAAFSEKLNAVVLIWQSLACVFGRFYPVTGISKTYGKTLVKSVMNTCTKETADTSPKVKSSV